MVPKGKITLEALRSITANIAKLRELRVKQDLLLKDLEYVIYLKYLWMSRIPDEEFEEKSGYYMRFRDRGSNIKGWLCIVRSTDKAEIRFPVFTKRMSFAGIIDMWDNGEIPVRLFDIFFEKHGTQNRGGYPDIGMVKQYRTQKAKRDAENEAFEKRYGHPRTPRPLMDVIRVKPSGDEVRLDSFPRDDGPQEVEVAEGTEGSESQEG